LYAIHIKDWKKVAVYASLAISIFIATSFGASFAAVILGCGQVFAYIHDFSSSGSCFLAHERLLHRSVHALDGYSSLTTRPWSFCASVPISTYHGLLLGKPFGEVHICCTRKGTLFHSIQDLWNAILFMMKRKPEGIFRQANKSRHLDTSMLFLGKAVTRSPLETITAMMEVRVRYPFP